MSGAFFVLFIPHEFNAAHFFPNSHGLGRITLAPHDAEQVIELRASDGGAVVKRLTALCLAETGVMARLSESSAAFVAMYGFHDWFILGGYGR
jgi:hypothetical protein